ncbi:hypothetical protein SISNIDRAFT_491733 [Sistotremastrum niveocremeum HHB9708]|uniref:F-box domain-containing protein n=1 Tax=Sistotremastrum niveocremeum HHB9708 TaxID=1314777 RepID=A0A164MGG4_9AGAM|nr:hypothetical protein SISNIDRAFT_491733 [Sistotremastrum niveocremeum HHB9708]
MLCEIFKHAHADCEDAVGNRNWKWINVLGVSKHWRAVGLNCPSLWRQIPNDIPSTLEQYCVRSTGNLTIQLHYKRPKQMTSLSNKISDNVVELHTAMWSTNGEPVASGVTSPLSAFFDNLTHIHFHAGPTVTSFDSGDFQVDYFASNPDKLKGASFTFFLGQPEPYIHYPTIIGRWTRCNESIETLVVRNMAVSGWERPSSALEYEMWMPIELPSVRRMEFINCGVLALKSMMLVLRFPGLTECTWNDRNAEIIERGGRKSIRVPKRTFRHLESTVHCIA